MRLILPIWILLLHMTCAWGLLIPDGTTDESVYDAENRLEQKLVAHAQLFLQIDKSFEIHPGVFFATQQGVNEIMAGADFLFHRQQLGLIAGLWYRLERDIIPRVGISYNGLVVQFSYDVNVSRLHLASNYRGGMEITVVKTLSLDANRKGCHEF